jgi:hypothetical protein
VVRGPAQNPAGPERGWDGNNGFRKGGDNREASPGVTVEGLTPLAVPSATAIGRGPDHPWADELPTKPIAPGAAPIVCAQPSADGGLFVQAAERAFRPGARPPSAGDADRKAQPGRVRRLRATAARAAAFEPRRPAPMTGPRRSPAAATPPHQATVVAPLPYEPEANAPIRHVTIPVQRDCTKEGLR